MTRLQHDRTTSETAVLTPGAAHAAERVGNASLTWRDRLLLLAVAALVLVPGMQVSLFDRDEGWYAQVAREMLESGDWLVPRYLGEVWIAKPPLLYWFVAGTYKLLGMGNWQARLVPVLAGCINVLLAGTLGAAMLGRRVGLLAGILLATSGLFATVGKMLLTDGVMLACTLGAILLHWRMRERPTHRGTLLYWVLIGAGVLAKGPATLVFAGAFGLGLLIGGWRAWIINWRYWVWLPASIAVAAPWYVYIAGQARGTLVEQFLWYEILSRITGAPHGHGGPPGYYLLLSLAGLLPWTALVPGAVLGGLAERRDPIVRLLLTWLLAPWILLELIHSKLPHYILPCYVPLMLLLARQTAAALGTQQPLRTGDRAQQAVLKIWVGSMTAFAAVMIVPGILSLARPYGAPLLVTGLVLIAGFVWANRALLQRTGGDAVRIACVTMVVGYAVSGFWLLPSLEGDRLSPRVAAALNQITRPGETAYLCGYVEPSVHFYLNGAGRNVSPGALEEFISSHPESLPIAVTVPRASTDALPQVPPALAERLRSFVQVEGFNYVKWEPTSLIVGRLEAQR